MKNKIYYLFGALAVLASCGKEVEKPEEPVVSNGKELVTLIAQTPQTRTTAEVDGAFVNFNWQSAEKIAVVEQDAVLDTPEKLNGALFTISNQENGAFTGTKTVGKDLLYAVSPASDLASANGTSYTLTLPETYTNYVPGTTNAVMIGVPDGMDGENYKFKLSHAAALVKVTYVNVPVGTKKLWFKADKNINGSYDLTSTTVSLGTPETGSMETWLELSEAVSTLNQTMDFYIPVPAATYGRFDIALYSQNGVLMTGTHKKKSSSTTLAKGDVFITPTVSLPEQVPATRGTYLLKEDFSGYTTGDKPVKPGTNAVVYGNAQVGYEYTGDTKVQAGDMFAGGNEPEIIIYKDSKSFSIKGIPTGLNKTITLRYKSNNGVSLSTTTEGVTIPTPTNDGKNYEAEITLSKYLFAFDLIMTNTNTSKNTRVDDIVLIAGTPFAEADLAFPAEEYTAIKELGFSAPVLTNPYELTVSYTSSNQDVAEVNASTGAVTLKAEGTTIITANYPGDGETYAPSSVSYTLTVENAFLTLSDATTPLKAESSAGSTVTFTVSSNLEWTAEKSSGDDIVSNVSASDKTVTVTFKKNSSLNEKSAVITVTPNESSLSSLAKEITVTQKAFENVDVLNRAWTGVNDGTTSYTNWSNKTGSSSGNTYAGNSAGSNNSIQLRNNNNSGIVSTSSASDDVVAKVTVSWNSNTTTPRGIKIYGKNSPYSGPSDLYESSTRGEELGTLNKTAANGTSQTLSLTAIEGDYEYIGILATGGANFIDEIRIEWASAAEKYAITIDENIENGTVSASKSSAAEGKTITLTTSPNPGYQLSSLTVFKTGDNTVTVPVSGDAFTMPAYPVTVTAVFSGIPTINMNTDSITNIPAAGVTNASENGAYTFEFGATDDQVEVTCDGVIVTSATKDSGNIYYTVSQNAGAARSGWIKVKYGSEEAHTINVSQKAATYQVTLNAPGSGYFIKATVDDNDIATSSTADASANVEVGKIVTVSATTIPENKVFSSWTINGATKSGDTNPATFTMGTSDVSVSAIFADKPSGAPVGTTMWAETWTGSTTATQGDNSATPSANYGKGTTVYNNGTVTYTQSANTVYVRNENLSGGTVPELMLSSGNTWTISGIPTGGASELTLTYKSNNTKSSVTCSTNGASITGSSKSYTITTGGAETITLVFGCSGNTRIDDVSLTVKTQPSNSQASNINPVTVNNWGTL